MSSPYCERAVNDAFESGRALFKFISRNDAGVTGSHQYGFYLPKKVWKLFTPLAPVKGCNHKHPVEIIWQSGYKTSSVVTWYGKGTRSEYRLTGFGRDFPFLNSDAVGSLLVLIPMELSKFHAYVFDLEDDIQEFQVSLGAEISGTWGVYEFGQDHIENMEECIDRRFRNFAASVDNFPSGQCFSDATREALLECIKDYLKYPVDKQLVKAVESEYALFKLVERRLCEPQIQRLFASVDDFIKTAASIMNRRKSRAGRSFENQMEFVLKNEGIPFDIRPTKIDGKPDIVIPSANAYNDESYPVEKLFVVGLKTTCKDRWRQVLNEGKRVPQKHLITMQRGISSNQLGEMAKANVSLIVPEIFHKHYPKSDEMKLKTIKAFVSDVKRAIII